MEVFSISPRILTYIQSEIGTDGNEKTLYNAQHCNGLLARILALLECV